MHYSKHVGPRIMSVKMQKANKESEVDRTGSNNNENLICTFPK